jgi:transposase
VSADAAYASHENMNTVAALGATPFVAFKASAKPKDDGSVYRKMFHYYSLRRDEFLSHYHKRSNVETTISMIKAKFGDSLRSKTDTAMINEALCKILCHNLCCLVQSAYELGVTVTFWQTKEPRSAAKLEDECEFADAMAWL